MSTSLALRGLSPQSEIKSAPPSKLELIFESGMPIGIGIPGTDIFMPRASVDNIAGGIIPAEYIDSLEQVIREQGGSHLLFLPQSEISRLSAEGRSCKISYFSPIPINEVTGKDYNDLISVTIKDLKAIPDQKKLTMVHTHVIHSSKDKNCKFDYNELSKFFNKNAPWVENVKNAYTPLAMRDRLRDKRALYYFIQGADKVIIAIIGCREMGGNVYIFDLVVAESFRKQGLASLLYNHLFQNVGNDLAITDSDANIFALADENERKYYAKLGFESVAEKIRRDGGIKCAGGLGLMYLYTPCPSNSLMNKYMNSLQSSHLAEKKPLPSSTVLHHNQKVVFWSAAALAVSVGVAKVTNGFRF